MGSNKPANPVISLLAVMAMLLVLFGLFREVALIQSENAIAQSHSDYNQLSADAKTEIEGRSNLIQTDESKTSSGQPEGSKTNNELSDVEINID